MQELFEMALNVTEPWYIKDVKFDSEVKRLDIYLDFKKGSVFTYKDDDTELAGLKVRMTLKAAIKRGEHPATC